MHGKAQKEYFVEVNLMFTILQQENDDAIDSAGEIKPADLNAPCKIKVKKESNDLVPFDGPLKRLNIQPWTPHRRRSKNIRVTVDLKRVKPFKCDICNKGVGTRGGMLYHIKAHLNGRPFQCNICQKSYATKNDFDTHFKRHSAKNVVCDFCCREFPVKQYLADHIRQMHLPKVIPCKFCKSKFSTEGSYKKHLSCIHKDRKIMFVCELCNMKFLSKAGYEEHCKKREKLKYQCPDCPKKFPCFLTYCKHRREERKNKLRKFCDKCKKYYKDIKCHDYQVHNNFTCEFCKTFTSTHAAYLKHRDQCGSAEQVRALGYHCEICDQYFKSKALLINHKHAFHGEHRCSICCRRFLTDESCRMHMRNHMSVKYRCILCPHPRCFSHKNTFNSHFNAQHSSTVQKRDGCGSNRWMCEMCKFHTPKKYKLYEHIIKCLKKQMKKS
jgi:hypothetical protein